jgi:hypothetical protein
MTRPGASSRAVVWQHAVSLKRLATVSAASGNFGLASTTSHGAETSAGENMESRRRALETPRLPT